MGGDQCAVCRFPGGWIALRARASTSARCPPQHGRELGVEPYRPSTMRAWTIGAVVEAVAALLISGCGGGSGSSPLAGSNIAGNAAAPAAAAPVPASCPPQRRRARHRPAPRSISSSTARATTTDGRSRVRSTQLRAGTRSRQARRSGSTRADFGPKAAQCDSTLSTGVHRLVAGDREFVLLGAAEAPAGGWIVTSVVACSDVPEPPTR